jgi:hypothetical protein
MAREPEHADGFALLLAAAVGTGVHYLGFGYGPIFFVMFGAWIFFGLLFRSLIARGFTVLSGALDGAAIVWGILICFVLFFLRFNGEYMKYVMVGIIVFLAVAFRVLRTLGFIRIVVDEKRRPAIPGYMKSAVYLRDGGMCRRCRSRDHIEYDHIIPWSKGGRHSIDNLQLLCRTCNRRKGARY